LYIGSSKTRCRRLSQSSTSTKKRRGGDFGLAVRYFATYWFPLKFHVTILAEKILHWKKLRDQIAALEQELENDRELGVTDERLEEEDDSQEELCFDF